MSQSGSEWQFVEDKKLMPVMLPIYNRKRRWLRIKRRWPLVAAAAAILVIVGVLIGRFV